MITKPEPPFCPYGKKTVIVVSKDNDQGRKWMDKISDDLVPRGYGVVQCLSHEDAQRMYQSMVYRHNISPSAIIVDDSRMDRGLDSEWLISTVRIAEQPPRMAHVPQAEFTPVYMIGKSKAVMDDLKTRWVFEEHHAPNEVALDVALAAIAQDIERRERTKGQGGGQTRA